MHSRWVVGALLVLAAGIPVLPGQTGVEVSGVVTLVWGDPQPGQGRPVGPLVRLATEQAGTLTLQLTAEQVGAAGGLLALNGALVRVVPRWPEGVTRAGLATPLEVASLTVLAARAPVAPAAVTGQQKFVSIACRFSGDPSEPRNLAYFQAMYGENFPELDDYFRELSYDAISVEGSTAVGWYALPKTRAQYMISPAPPAGVYPRIDLDDLFDDCTALADSVVDFREFVGINMMFNDNLDDASCCSWGGTRCRTLDGQYKCFRTTWEAEWGFSSIGVVQHEMGHAFGWPHSSGDYCETYDNHWDVMSDSWLCNPSHATYGCYGQHTIAQHLDLAGWIPGHRKVTVSPGEAKSVRLDRLAWPWTRRPLMVKATKGGVSSEFLTYEARHKTSYDTQLAGSAVIVHDVKLGRYDTSVCGAADPDDRPAHVVDTDGDGDTSDSGAQFLAGEIYTDGAIRAHVESVGATGMVVNVANDETALAARRIAVSGGYGTAFLEPAESAVLQPTWFNFATGSYTPTGTLAGAAGLTVTDAAAAYPLIHDGSEGSCASTGNCYGVTLSGARPQTHWDVTVTETLASPAREQQWVLHVGGSFPDVSTSSELYPYVEALLHTGVTTGCTTTTYCPTGTVTRAQMATFIARAVAGSDAAVPASGYVVGKGSYDCTSGGTSRFPDVTPTSSACRHIHYIAARDITLGCDATNFCPGQQVTRAQMALFIARAVAGRDRLVPTTHTDPDTGLAYSCGTTPNLHFTDVAAGATYCRHAHFLWARGIIDGCTTSKFCPGNRVNRLAMAKFLANGFTLRVHEP